jgi:hypothetical protein
MYECFAFCDEDGHRVSSESRLAAASSPPASALQPSLAAWEWRFGLDGITERVARRLESLDVPKRIGRHHHHDGR